MVDFTIFIDALNLVQGPMTSLVALSVPCVSRALDKFPTQQFLSVCVLSLCLILSLLCGLCIE
jgi:hypothetical protein